MQWHEGCARRCSSREARFKDVRASEILGKSFTAGPMDHVIEGKVYVLRNWVVQRYRGHDSFAVVASIYA
eukprot:5132436-Pyramimonas_sp.AAC.1